MQLEEIIDLFSVLSGLNGESSAQGATYGIICQDYLTFLKICFIPSTSDNIKQSWYAEGQQRFLIKLLALKETHTFRNNEEYKTLIDNIHDDVSNNGNQLQNLLRNEQEAQQLIIQLNSVMDFKVDVLLDDLSDIFFQLPVIQTEYDNQAWGEVIYNYQHIRTKLITYPSESFDENQRTEILKYQRLYMLALTQLATLKTTLADTVDAFHRVLAEANHLRWPDAMLISDCVNIAITRIIETKHNNSRTVITTDTVSQMLNVMNLANRLAPVEPLASNLRIIQKILIDTLLSMGFSHWESRIKNLILAIDLQFNYLKNSSENITEETAQLYSISSSLYSGFKNFLESGAELKKASVFLSKIINQNNSITFNPADSAWLKHQSLFLCELSTSIRIMVLRLHHKETLGYWKILYDQLKTIPEDKIVNDDEQLHLTAYQDYAEALYYAGEEYFEAKDFHSASACYQHAQHEFTQIAPRSAKAQQFLPQVKPKVVIALMISALKKAVVHRQIDKESQAKVERAIHENQDYAVLTQANAYHQTLFAKLLFDYATIIFTQTVIPLPALHYFKAAAYEINKLVNLQASTEIQRQIHFYNQCVLENSVEVCKRFTDFELNHKQSLEILVETCARLTANHLPNILQQKFEKAVKYNLAMLGNHVQSFKDLTSPRNFIVDTHKNSPVYQQIMQHFQMITAVNPCQTTLVEFKRYIAELNSVTPPSIYKNGLAVVSPTIDNLIVLVPHLVMMTPQLLTYP